MQPNLLTLPAELHILIATHLYDDEYIIRRLNGMVVEWHVERLPDPKNYSSLIPTRVYDYVHPLAALAMTNQYFWQTVPLGLKRPLPVQLVDNAEELMWMRGDSGPHWGRQFGGVNAGYEEKEVGTWFGAIEGNGRCGKRGLRGQNWN